MITGKIKRLQKAKVINNSNVGNGFGNQDFYLMESFLVLRLILMNIKNIIRRILRKILQDLCLLIIGNLKDPLLLQENIMDWAD